MANTTPTFLANAVFGDPSQFTAAIFAGTAAQEDAFLGLAPGTTRYGPCELGGGIAIRGVLTGTTTSAVEAAQQALAGMADQTGPAILPTGIDLEGWDVWASCWFSPGDLAFSPSGIVPGSAGYQIAYALILRRAGGPLP